MAKCQQAPVNLYKCLIHSLLYAMGSKRKIRSEPCLVCGREEESKLGMVIPLKRGNGVEGEGERENGVSKGGFLS